MKVHFKGLHLKGLLTVPAEPMKMLQGIFENSPRLF